MGRAKRRTTATVKAKPRAGAPQVIKLVVGIGASAGGLEAYRAFFTAMPSDAGMAFVIVQHLDPEHASSLVEILRSNTAMDVSTAESGAALVANHIFVIPPDAIMRIEGGVLQLTRPAAPIQRRTSIDTFLTSLAEDQRQNAVGIILSGYGSDGARGVTAIKEHGGLTMAQAGSDHSPKVGMPQSAASSGFVDHVLEVPEMPAALIRYLDYRTATTSAEKERPASHDVAPHLTTICALLSSRLGRDFSQYKTSTIMRRVKRRMQVLQINDVLDYIQQLRERPTEPDLLFHEMLIGVTKFFRDAEAFTALASTFIRQRLAEGDRATPIRVWVAGCATGEEAYSLAILFKDALAAGDHRRTVQIFATDINDQAVEFARAGLYPAAALTDLAQDRLERYFTKEGDQYRIARSLREMCLFSVHDLVKDPPFSKLDLISCRNVLIYFGAKLQKRVFTMFHYGLVPHGMLFLGSSEAVVAQDDLFSSIDRKHRLFQRRDVPSRVVVPGDASIRGRSTPDSKIPATKIAPVVARIMARYAPAFAIVDRQQAVQQFSGHIAKFLEPASGTASLKLSNLIQPRLRAPLQAALKEAASAQRRVITENLFVEVGGRKEALNLVVEPLPKPAAGGFFIVVFQELGAVSEAKGRRAPASREGELLALQELNATRETLQTVTEELETANEELQSSNEEYQTVNEELQSTNEELETSKEELQSINEELHTINAELGVRNDNLADLNGDLTNLINSTSIATLFLDNDLRIKRFTPAVLEIFNIRVGDEGRPITDIVSQLSQNGLARDVREVIRTLIPVEREVELNVSEKVYQMQIRPYRSTSNAITGVVVTFVDISIHKQHERDRAKLSAIVESSEDAIISHDLEGAITSWNGGAQSIYGYAQGEVLGQSMTKLLSANQEDEWPKLLARLRRGEVIRHFDSTRTAKDGRVIDISLTISPMKDSSGTIVGASAVARDISNRKRAEKHAALLMSELDHRVKNILGVVSSLVKQTLEGAESPADFATTIESRIQAIAKAHSLLTRDGRDGALLGAIVETELAPYVGKPKRVAIGGADVTLTPRAGMAIAMALHELTTNAAKYGALSAVKGRLSVTWDSTGGGDDTILRIVWTESGGPTVQAPTKRGFGTTLIERALSHELDAVVRREFLPAGLRCVIEIRLTTEVGYLGLRDAALEIVG